MLWLEGGCGSWQAATGLQQEQSKACRGLYERRAGGGSEQLNQYGSSQHINRAGFLSLL